MDKSESGVINDSRVHKSAKVCDVIKNNNWNFPNLIHEDTLRIWEYIKKNVVVNESIEDKISWKLPHATTAESRSGHDSAQQGRLDAICGH